MRVFRRVKWGTWFSMLACVGFISACGESGSDKTAEFDVTSVEGRATVYGKVVDFSTDAPISGAKAKLLVSDKVLSTTTKANFDISTEAEADEKGKFEFQGVASGDYRLRVESDGYATYEKWITVDAKGADSYYFAAGVDGKILLGKGCDVDVYVTTDGVVANDFYVYADNSESPEIEGKTDAEGHVIFKGLSQVANYTIVAPARDVDNDGIYDYSTGLISSYSCVNSDKTASIAMPKASRDDSIRLVGGSYQKYQTPSSSNEIGADESMIYVFNYPVGVSLDGMTLSYDRDLVHSTDPDHDKTLGVEVKSTLSAGNTILTVDPANSLIQNETYRLSGVASATVGRGLQYYDFSTNFYVFSSDAISNDTVVLADNLNSFTRVAGKPAGTVYLKFPEYVYGKATISAYTRDGTVVTLDSPFVVTVGGGAYVAIDENTGGCTGGECNGKAVYYLDSLFNLPAFSDDAPGSANNVTVFIDVADVEGHRIQKLVTLPIE